MREQSPLSLQRFFRIAILIFALTVGIGLYALIGAPVVRIEQSALFTRSVSTIQKSFRSVQQIFSIHGATASPETTLIIEATDQKSTYISLRTSLIERKLGPKEKISVVFQREGAPLFAYSLLQFLTKNSLPESLAGQMTDSTYIIGKDISYLGLFVSPISDPELVYASIVPKEKTFATALLPLLHPLMSPNEIESYLGLSIYAKKLAGTDVRMIAGPDGKPVFIWGMYKNTLIVSGDQDIYKNAVDILEKTP